MSTSSANSTLKVLASRWDNWVIAFSDSEVVWNGQDPEALENWAELGIHLDIVWVNFDRDFPCYVDYQTSTVTQALAAWMAAKEQEVFRAFGTR